MQHVQGGMAGGASGVCVLVATGVASLGPPAMLERISRPALSVGGVGARAMSWCTFDIF